MTENVDSACSILEQSSQLGASVPLPSSCNAIVSQLDGTVFLNSNIMGENSCLYTSADLSGTFPEGTVLQILPDSTILAVPPIKELSNAASNPTTIIFKDSSFATDLAQDPSAVSNMLVETVDACEPSASEVPICSEGNISDIDLSFLNEPESNAASKNLTIRDLQRIMTAASSDSLEDVLQSNLSNPDPDKDLEQPSPQESNTTPEDVVMIDVSKPIQLSQNSLIMVNGQKCVLQHDPETGQVIAYPVKEQEKPRRRRGRPRKSSLEQTNLDFSQNSENPLETESVSDEGKEKGLLEVVTDDGSLVKRSSRKRKKAKVLKDYETGNLKQELGSDVEVDVGEMDPELLSRKKKSKIIGRPRKYPALPTEKIASEPLENNGIKRQRGRPRKQIPTAEPTQAFLVQTVDGQTLMMQVPKSSIPEGLSLQEVAQNIANKLNSSLSQANNTVTDIGSLFQPLQNGLSDLGLASEPSVLNQSVESTSSLEHELHAESEMPSSSEANISNGMDEVQEVNLKGADDSQLDCNESVAVLLDDQEQLATIEVPTTPDESLTLPVSTSSFISSSSVLNSLPESLSDQIAGAKPDDQDIENSFSQFQIPKDFLINGENLQQLLANVVNNSSSDSQLAESCVDQIATSVIKDSHPATMGEFIISDSEALKDFDGEFSADIVNSDTKKRKESEPEISAENSSKGKGHDFLNCNLTDSILDSNMVKSAIQSNSIMSSIEHDHNLLAQSNPKPVPQKKVLLPKVSSFQPILPMDKITSILSNAVSDNSIITTPTATVVPVSSGQQLEIADKLLPIVLSQDLPGSKKCKVCQRPYFTDEELIKHFKSEHPKCICNQCNYMADHAYVIKRHSIRHTEKVIACHLCGKHYKDHYILKIHIKMVHLPAEVIFTCEICDKQFNRKAHLKRHLRIHAPHRPYKCSFCNYRGCEKSDITKHLLIHEAPKHKCHLCDKAFRHLKNKELHLKRHYKQRDYKCGICNFYGYTFTDIRKHIERRHGDAKGTTCSECATVFKSDIELEEHKNSGQCLGNSIDCKLELEDSLPAEDSNESPVIEDMPLDLLGSENPQEMEVNSSSKENLVTLQPNQLILNSVDSMLGAQNGQIVISGLDTTNLLPSENLSFLTLANDSSKMITLVTSDGKNFMLPIKTSSASESFDGILLKQDDSANVDSFQTELSYEIDDPS